MAAFQDIKAGLRHLYLEDKRPWPVGFSGGKDSTMPVSLAFDPIVSIPPEQRKKEVSVVRTDTRVEISAIAEIIGGTLDPMRGWTRAGRARLGGQRAPTLASISHGATHGPSPGKH
jgi:hypothetical protein